MNSKEPYVIRQGDHLLLIAYQRGFDPDDVWGDDANASMSQRRDPDMLHPTEILYVPAPQDPPSHVLSAGETNAFVSDVPTFTLSIKVLDENLASHPCTVVELDQLADLATGADGSLSFDAPVTLKVATIRFDEPDVTCVCRIGSLDPIDTPSGISQRLQNLGYIDPDAQYDGDLELLRDALAALRQEGAGNDDASGDPDEGLADDGTLADATGDRLRDAHGC